MKNQDELGYPFKNTNIVLENGTAVPVTEGLAKN